MQTALSVDMHFTREIRRILNREPLDADAMARLWGAVLDESLDDIEIGAVIAALAIAGETREELAGLYRATRERQVRWSPPLRRGAVSMAAYGLAAGESLAVPLACALLRRFDIPVVIHGVLDSPCGVSSASVLRELGILPCASFVQADERLESEGVAFLPAQLVSPALAALVALRARLGIENSAHRVAQAIDPTHGLAVRVTLCTEATASERFDAFADDVDGDSIAVRWPQGRSPLNLSMRPRIERLRDGTREVLFEADTQETPSALAPVPEDAPGIAQWIRRATSGAVPVPVPALALAAACLYAVGVAADLNQAKALAAFQAGRLAA